jgi:cyclophilin family peptidyl-prolyl cis-trans isomerase
LLRHDCSCMPNHSVVHADTNTAHFSIMMGPEPHNDGHYTVFGAVAVLLVLPICVGLLQ